MTPNTTHAIGIDVGGTKIAGGLVELSTGRVLVRRHRPTLPERGGPAVLAEVLSQARELAAEAQAHGASVAGLGVGLPQLVTPDGRVDSDHLFDWRNLPAVEQLSGVAPARLESDVRAAAWAEAHFGAGRGHDIVCYISIGTGVSYCLVLNGRPFAGVRGYAIHFATMPQTIRCRACGVMHTALLEQTAGGPGIAAAYGHRRGRAIAGAEEVLAAAAAGDREAIGVIDDAEMRLGAAIGLVVDMVGR